MYVVGVIEIVAGLVVLLKPRFGGYLVSAWLAGIIVNLLLIGDYYDIALRDFGLLLAALTLARLRTAFPSGATRDRQPRCPRPPHSGVLPQAARPRPPVEVGGGAWKGRGLK